MPVDVCGIPVERLANRLLLDVDQVDAAVTLALLAATDDGACDQLDYWLPNPFRTDSQIVRGRSCALILR
jgi:hypothetical protein